MSMKTVALLRSEEEKSYWVAYWEISRFIILMSLLYSLKISGLRVVTCSSNFLERKMLIIIRVKTVLSLAPQSARNVITNLKNVCQ